MGLYKIALLQVNHRAPSRVEVCDAHLSSSDHKHIYDSRLQPNRTPSAERCVGKGVLTAMLLAPSGRMTRISALSITMSS